MTDHGRGYKEAASTTLGLEGLISFDGDGLDIDLNGVPDAKINPDLIHIDSDGGIYLEQTYEIEVSSTASLLTTVITFEDANQTIAIDFAPTDSLPFTVGIIGRTTSEIRDEIIENN